jgi:hypothetical protein
VSVCGLTRQALDCPRSVIRVDASLVQFTDDSCGGRFNEVISSVVMVFDANAAPTETQSIESPSSVVVQSGTRPDETLFSCRGVVTWSFFFSAPFQPKSDQRKF